MFRNVDVESLIRLYTYDVRKTDEPADVRRFCESVAQNDTFFDSTIEAVQFSQSDPNNAFAVSKGGALKVIGMPNRYDEALSNPTTVSLAPPVTSMFSFQKGTLFHLFISKNVRVRKSGKVAFQISITRNCSMSFNNR